MQAATMTDAYIRANGAFPLVARIARQNKLFCYACGLIAAVGACLAVFDDRSWGFIVVGVIAVIGLAGQFYNFRCANVPLSQLSDDKGVRDRAWVLATGRWAPWSRKLS
jgi:hypothetical protein